MAEWTLQLLDTPVQMTAVEDLQRLIWSGSETEVVPASLLLASIHNGGLAIGAYAKSGLIGFVFGFPGLSESPAGLISKHCSHMLGVHPDWRNAGLGFALKRAQWQMVRHQGLDCITWTYDPLLSCNAHLNIARLGAVCSTYLCNAYGKMRDGMNAGLPSDRFQVDWWLRSRRVERRLGRTARSGLKPDQVRVAGVETLAGVVDPTGWLHPPEKAAAMKGKLVLVEIPQDILALKEADLSLAQSWRLHARSIFSQAFDLGYVVTDFVHDPEGSYYLLSDGKSYLE